MSQLKASATDQAELLDLQSIDNAITRAKAEIAALKSDAEHAKLRTSLADAATRLEQARSEKAAAKKSMDTAEDAVITTQTRQESLQNTLDAGAGSAKDLQKLGTEIEHLEDRLLEQMQTEEDARSEFAAQSRLVEELRDEHTRLEAELASHVQTLNERGQQATAEGKKQVAARAELVATLPEDLVDAYNQARTRNGGIGAAKLEGNTSTASGLPLAPRELAEINALADDEVAFCPETEAILVR